MTQTTTIDAELDTGLAHHEAGRLADAEASYRGVLTADPDHADALNLLGVIRQDRGDLTEAVALLSHAIAVDPEFADAFVNLARARNLAGDAVSARGDAERALQLDPELADAWLQLARARFALGDDPGTAEAARRAIALMSSIDAQILLGHALTRMKDFQAAEAAWRDADGIAPDRYEVVLNLGIVLTELRQGPEAVRFSQRAAELNPTEATAHAALAAALLLTENIPASIDALAKAVALAPDDPVIARQQGDHLSVLGRFDEAAACYRRVLALDQASSHALSSLAAIGRLPQPEESKARLREVFADPARPAFERIRAGFALGEVLDADGDYEKAFATYAEANRLTREAREHAGVRFNRTALHAWVRHLRANFGPRWFAAASGWGSPTDLPVFVVGMPRSGTSLIEQILASHPKVFGAGERKDISELVARLDAAHPGQSPADWDATLVRRETDAQTVRWRTMAGPALRVIDKLPDNLPFAGAIAGLFPRARIILARRDPRDVCLSCFFRTFDDSVDWDSDLADCAERACEMDALASHWHATLPLPILQVDYETLIDDLEGEARRMIDFLGLEWNNSCLNFQATERVVRTASFFQVRQPLYSSSVGRWRHYRDHIQALSGALAGVVPGSEDDASIGDIAAGAMAHLTAGRREAAAFAFRVVLERAPDHPDALYGLGRLARESGEPARALPLLLRSLDVRPNDGPTLLELSRVHRLLGDFSASAAVARTAIVASPADPSAHFLLGSAQLDLGETREARDTLARAVELAPPWPEAHRQLAQAYTRLHDHAAAAGSLREALRLQPNDAETIAKLGHALGELGLHEEAMPFLRQAVALAPGDGRTHLALLAGLWLAHDIEAGLAACPEAIRVAPDLADLWLHDGHFKAAVGRFQEAETSYRNALDLAPDLDSARSALIGIGVRGEVDQDETRLLASLNDSRRKPEDRVGAGYALGELLDRGRDFEGAWKAYEAANKLARAIHQDMGHAFDPALFDAQIERIAERFPKVLFQASADLGNPSEVPVFVVGMPRSGTTLVEQIACSHPAVFGAGELSDIEAAALRLDAAASDLASIADDADGIAAEASIYLARLYALAGDAPRVVDKMPDNFLFLGLVALLFPRARVVICRRDYRDVALSCYFQNFGEKIPWSTNLVDLAARIQSYDRLMEHWRAVLPLPVLEIQYEDLVQDLEAGSRRLIEFLGLDWDPACLAFHQTERPVMTASQWQVRQPIYTSSAGRWRGYSAHLRPLLAGLAGLVPSDGDEDWDQLATEPAAALVIGTRRHRAGHFEQAEAVYQALLRRSPNDSAVLHLLAQLCIQRRQTAEALALLSRASQTSPHAAPILADLAEAYILAGDLAAAENAAREALALDPTQPDAHVQAGRVLALRNDLTAAIPILRRAIELAPRSIKAWHAFATALAELRDHKAASLAWQAALEISPGNPDLMLGLGEALVRLRQFDDAIALFQAVNAIAPGRPEPIHGMAVAKLGLGDAAGAADICRQVLAQVQEGRFWLLLANCEATLGHFDAAAEGYRNAAALDPTIRANAMHDLASLGGHRDEDAALEDARLVLADPAAPVTDHVAAGFALGLILDRRGDYDGAFESYALGNRLLRADRNARGFRFDREAFRAQVDRQIAGISQATFAASSGWGDPSEEPVFIIGMPRSGTSLVEQIAASHRSVFGAGERIEIYNMLRGLEEGKPGCPPNAWNPDSARRAAAGFARLLRELGGDARRVIDKQPDNILALGQIAVLFPNARVVLCRRDPRDTALSCYFQYFRDDPLVWTDDLADCGFRLHEIERLMRHWQRVLPIPILEIEYETLVANLERESRRLIDFLGVEWDPACLSFHETERTVITASHWQVRQPLYTSSTGRWRHYERHLGPLLQELYGISPPERV